MYDLLHVNCYEAKCIYFDRFTNHGTLMPEVIIIFSTPACTGQLNVNVKVCLIVEVVLQNHLRPEAVQVLESLVGSLRIGE